MEVIWKDADRWALLSDGNGLILDIAIVTRLNSAAEYGIVIRVPAAVAGRYRAHGPTAIEPLVRSVRRDPESSRPSAIRERTALDEVDAAFARWSNCDGGPGLGG